MVNFKLYIYHWLICICDQDLRTKEQVWISGNPCRMFCMEKIDLDILKETEKKINVVNSVTFI